jgi:hypothetical protein
MNSRELAAETAARLADRWLAGEHEAVMREIASASRPELAAWIGACIALHITGQDGRDAAPFLELLWSTAKTRKAKRA